MADLQFDRNNGSILFIGTSQQEKMLFASLFGSFYKVEFVDLPLPSEVGLSFDLYIVNVDAPLGCDFIKESLDGEKKRNVLVYGDIASLTKDEIVVVSRALDQFQTPLDRKTFAKRIKNNLEFITAKEKPNVVSTERDNLTGLQNRQGFVKTVGQAIASSSAGSWVVTCMDIDGFKHINERMGHTEGNNVLKTVAEIRKREVSKVGGYVCRDMGDIFFALVPNDDAILEEITNDLHERLKEIKTTFPLGCHIGRYAITDKDTNVNSILDRALFACKSIKYSTTKREVWFNEKMLGNYILDQEMTEEMENALENREFVVHYQPQIRYVDGTLSGVEALVRWQHPRRGLIRPKNFIELFERNGFIAKLDPYVWEEAAKSLAKWNQEGRKIPSISVNVSYVDFVNLDLVETLQDIVIRNGIKPWQIHLEIKESTFINNKETVLKTVNHLREIGYIIEMDDFGSGSSSLNILKDVPAHFLKLDSSFIRDSETNEKSGIILSSIVRMANWLHLPVIAEGVEKLEQAEFLKTIGCPYMQGYHFSIPLNKEDFEEKILNKLEVMKQKSNKQDENTSLSFLDSSTQASLLFNSFVGGAIIAEASENALEVIRVNDAFFDVMNVSFESFVGSMINFYEAITEESLPVFKKSIAKAKETRKTQTCEAETKKNAAISNVWIEFHCRYLTSNGSKDLYCITAEDVTERKRDQNALKRDFGLLIQTIQTIPVGFARLSHTPEGFRFTYINESLYKLLGYPNGYFNNLLQYDFYPYIHPDDLDGFRALARELTKKNEAFEADLRMMKADGTFVWMRLAGSFLKIADKSLPITLNLTLTDITSLKALEASQKSLISNSPGGVIVLHLDKTGVNCSYVSESFLRLTGFDADTAREVFGEIEKSVHPDDLKKIQEASGRAFQTLTSFSEDYRIINAKGEYFWINLTGSPVMNADGSIDFYCTYTDIDRHVRSEEKTRLENKRNRLYLEMNNLAIFDYEIATDTLAINVNWANQGYTELKFPEFLAFTEQDGKITEQGMSVLRDTFKACQEDPHQGSVDVECDIWGEGLAPVRVTYVCGTDDMGRLSGITGVIQNLTEEKNKNKILRMIEGTAKFAESDITKLVFNYLSENDVNSKTIYESLKMIGLYFNSSRAYLMEFDEVNHTLARAHEWTKEGIINSISKEVDPAIIAERSKVYQQETDENGYLVCNDTDALAETLLKKRCKAFGIKSLIQYRTKIDEEGHAFILGLDNNDETQEFDENVKETLKLFANIFRVFLRKVNEAATTSLSKANIELLDSVADHYMIVDPDDYYVIHASEAFQRDFGKAEKSMPCYKQYFGLNQPCEHCPIRKAKEGNPEPLSEYAFRNGKWVLAKTKSFYLAGKPVFVNSYTDITSRIEAQERLRKLGSESIATIQLGGAHVVKYNFKTGTGSFYQTYSEEGAWVVPNFEEALFKLGYVSKGFEREIHVFFSSIRQGQKRCHVDTVMQLPGQEPIWVRLDSMLIEDGNNDCVMITVRDIQKSVDLENETKQMRKMAAEVPVGVVIYDMNKETKDLTMSFYNKELVRIMGGNEAEILDFRASKGVDFDSNQDSLDRLKTFCSKLPDLPGQSASIDDVDYITPNGRKHCKIVASVYLETKEVIRIFVVVIDTTKEYEDKLLIEQRTNDLSVIENSLNGAMVISSTSLTKPLLFISQNIRNFLGYSPDEVNAMHFIGFRDIIYKEDYERVGREFMRIDRERPMKFEHELRFVKKDGTVFWALSKGTHLDDYQGHEAYLIAYLDISNLKKNEERLSIDEESYKFGFSNTSNLIFSYDALSKELTTPTVLCDTYGIARTITNVPDSTVARGDIDDRSIDNYMALYKAIRMGKSDFEIEIRARFYGADFHWYKASFQIVKKEHGLPRKAVILYKNIDEEKEKKEAVDSKKESEQILSIIASHSNKYLISYDFKTGKLQPIDDPENHARRVLPLLDTPLDYVTQGIVAPEHVDIIKAQFQKFINGERNFKLRFKAKNDQGKMIWTEVIATTIFVDGKPSMTIASVSDITEAHELEIAFSHYKESLKGDANEESYYLDFDITNGHLEKMSDSITYEPLKKTAREGYLACMNYIKGTFIDEEQERLFERNFIIKEPAFAQREKEMVFKSTRPDKTLAYTAISYQIVKDPYTNDYRIVFRWHIINKTKQKELELLNKARYDEVTKQFNRSAFIENVVDSIKLNDKGKSNGAFVIFDIDNFKTINDTFGHVVGDHALAIISESAAAIIDGQGYIGRLGGDEFGIFISSYKDMDDLKNLLNEIQNAGSYEIAKGFKSSISVGVSILHKDGETFEELYKKADIALYSVKKNGKDSWALFDETMDKNVESSATPIDN